MMNVQTKQGKLKVPRKERGYYSFKGIPYACLPGRFARPQEAGSWEGIRECEEYGKYCSQILMGIRRGRLSAFLSGERSSSETDCLNLNVYTPSCKGKHPVLVYLPFSAFVMGFHNDLFDHEYFVQECGFTVVTINPRVGILGFLQVDEVLGEDYIQSGNNGILDALQACRWIKQNIAAFGGDPDNITIMGGSSGAMALSSLMLMKEFAGLVNRVILESGSANRMRDLPTAHEYTRRFFALYDIDYPQEKEKARKLLLGPLEELAEHWPEFQTQGGDMRNHHHLAPVLDGVTYPGKDALEIIRSGDFCREIAVMAGYTRHEYAGFLQNREIDYLDLQSADELYLDLAGDYLASQQRLAPEGYADFYRLTKFCTFYVYANGTLKTFEEIAKASPETKLYLYRFDWNHADGYASHGSDYSFFRGHFTSQPGIEQNPCYQPFKRYSGQMLENFIRSGDPNDPDPASGWPQWPRYTAKDRQMYCLNLKAKVIRAPRIKDEPFHFHITQKRDS